MSETAKLAYQSKAKKFRRLVMNSSSLLLLGLATELVENIVINLEGKDLFSLRCTCKTLSEKTIHVFGKRYFSIVWTNFRLETLKKVQCIAENHLLRKNVRTLFIRDEYEDTEDPKQFCLPRDHNGIPKDPQKHPHVKILQETLLKGLINCRSICIRVGSWRLRDLSKDWGTFQADVTHTIFSILEDTRIQLRSLDVDVLKYGLYLQQTETSICRRPLFREAWAHIQDLHMGFSGEFTTETETFAVKFLARAPRLQRLSLRHGDSLYERMTAFKAQCIASGGFPPVLQELRLDYVPVSTDELAQLLRPCRGTLQRISLKNVTQLDGESWANIFEHLRGQYLKLEALDVMNCHREDDWDDISVMFNDPSRLLQTTVCPNELSPIPVNYLPVDRKHDFGPQFLQPHETKHPNTPAYLNLRFVTKDDPYATGFNYEGPRLAEVLLAIIQSIEIID